MKTLSLTLVAAVICSMPALVLAADSAAQNPAYLVDGSGNNVKNVSGECWRTGEWTPALATAPCDAVIAPVAVVAAPAPMVATTVPEPKAVAPAPAPVVVLVPVTQKISFSGDALFGFDKSVLRPESRELLDGLARQLTGTTSDSITVTGNTDRIGSSKYNQKLSEQRAVAVKDYLVSKNVQATSIVAKGVGETEPVTKLADCKGNKANAKLIACLQPDRRVDVEMTGTKTGPAVK
jgi:OOP family OmpA-OmpF porin